MVSFSLGLLKEAAFIVPQLEKNLLLLASYREVNGTITMNTLGLSAIKAILGRSNSKETKKLSSTLLSFCWL